MPRIPTSLPAFVALFASATIYAQSPTNQDCLNAIPICQNVYTTVVSYSGEGNYPNEINSGSSCLLSGELNDVWYTFTVQQSGNLNFLITPNNSADDYDWAVYNLTNNNCADIFTNPGLEVSCNFSATPGTTGPNGGSAFTSQNAGGTPYNNVIPVTVGQTYVVNVSNFSSTQNGYTIDFSASTAVIFDQIPPQILSVSNPGCGGNTLTVTFSENILCNTVQNGDFTFTGPGGPYSVLNVTSAACAAGAQYDNTFTFTISPNIAGAGTYSANLVGPVTDLCGNVCIFPASLPFTVGSFTYTTASTPASCIASNGSATVNVSGAGPFTYTWSPNVSTTNTASNIPAGVYTVTITDQSNGCTSTDTIHVNSNTTLNVTTSGDDTICPGTQATMSVNVIGGNNPVTYTWSNGLPNSPTVTDNPAVTTTYTLNIVDAAGCTAGPLLFTITVASPVGLTISGTSPICVGGGTTLTANVTGGYGTLSYQWMPGNLNTQTVNVSPAVTTTYTLTTTDQCGQTATQMFTVVVSQVPVVDFYADTTYGCTPLLVNFFVDTTGFGSGATLLWSFGENNATSSAVNPSHSYITAGCHDVSLTVTVPPGCSVTQTYNCMITTLAQPVAQFTANPQSASILDPLVSFTNQSTGATNWVWNFGDSTTSLDWSPQHLYDAVGVYPVYLAVSNASGCSDTAWLDIIVNDYHTFFVPNAFTPNGNGTNDEFGPEFTNILSEGYDFLIFDRWGNIVFETHNPYDKWNGKWQNKGDMVQQDVYVYKIAYLDNMYGEHHLMGSVTVLPGNKP
jgi:gliding motility-associated-like protein